MKHLFQGGCLCGAMRYVAEGVPLNVRVCHCRLCQRAIGAAFNARVLMPAAAVTLDGRISEYRSSPDLMRGFCLCCGSSVFSRRVAAGLIGLTCGSLDKPEQFKPTAHIWTSSMQPWVHINDGLPQYPEAAPSPQV